MRNHYRGREASPCGPPHPPATRVHGFTMMELSVVIVIIGLLLAGGTAGFYAVLEGRRVAKTQALLEQAKQCLLKRIYLSNQYPSYTGDDSPADNTDNMDCDGTYGTDYDNTAKDVDACLCGKLDAWGENFYFIEGLRAVSLDPLSSDDFYVSDNPAQNEEAVAPDASGSQVIDKDGNTIRYVAFVLLSAGRDRSLDNSSYANLFTGSFRALPLSGTPDFSSDDTGTTDDDTIRDDQVVIVTGVELRSLMTAQ